jgi:acetylornithine deacetylase/succinyl-diaminopimelate desuccinylase-like protein
MYDHNGILDIPGIDNDPASIESSIVSNNQRLPFDNSEFLAITGASRRQLDGKTDFYSQTGFLTSAEITSLKSGYIGSGYRNAIPGTAEAKINFRISPAYKTSQVVEAFEKFIKSKRERHFELSLSVDQMSDPIKLDSDNEFVRITQSIASEVYEKECLLRYCGAIVPVAGIFTDLLGVPVVSIGLANEDCNMHGADENFDIELIKKGLQFSQEMLGE